MRSVARARRRVASFFEGADACPPAPCAVTVTSTWPFSETPTMAMGEVTPRGTPVATAPPSSRTMQGCTLCSRSHATALSAVGPDVSSQQDEKNQMSRGGT